MSENCENCCWFLHGNFCSIPYPIKTPLPLPFNLVIDRYMRPQDTGCPTWAPKGTILAKEPT